VIKSAIDDFLPCLAAAAIIIPLFFVVAVEFLKDPAMINSMERPTTIPIILFGLLFFGFYGIIEAIEKTNWMFHAILASDFNYHFKRAILFLAILYGIPFLLYIFISTYIDIKTLPAFMFNAAAAMVFAVNAAFFYGYEIKKMFFLILCIVLSMYICYINPYFMVISIVPVIFMGIKVCNVDYFDWMHL
jgi:hypothetical protein